MAAKPRGKPFQGPGDPRNGPSITEQSGATNARTKEEPVSGYCAPSEDGAPQVLQDMRHVYMNPKRHDRTEGQRFQREFREKQPAAFNSQLTEMEDRHKKEVQAKAPVAAKVVDHGTDRALAQIKRILAGEERAKCPKCGAEVEK
jgi:hypothetical protein